MRMTMSQAIAVIVASAAALLGGCVSTVSFRASPAPGEASRLSCLESSSGICAFAVTGAEGTRRTYEVAVGQSVAVPVPEDGAEVRGCVAHKALASCSSVHVKPSTTAASHAQGW